MFSHHSRLTLLTLFKHFIGTNNHGALLLPTQDLWCVLLILSKYLTIVISTILPFNIIISLSCIYRIYRMCSEGSNHQEAITGLY